MAVIKIRDIDGSWIKLPTIKGDKGDPGDGNGDMEKSVYDKDDSGKVDVAKIAEDSNKLGGQLASYFATLSNEGRIPFEQLPPFLKIYNSWDDHLSPVYSKNILYYIILEDKFYIYNPEEGVIGDGLVEVLQRPKLGTSSEEAFYGDWGNEAYEHSQIRHDKAFVGLGKVLNEEQMPLSGGKQFGGSVLAVADADGTSQIRNISTKQGGSFTTAELKKGEIGIIY